MKIWIYIDGVQQGPYSYEQLVDLPIQPDTPVWYYGLPKWTAASDAPATAGLFRTQRSAAVCPEVPEAARVQAQATGWQATTMRAPQTDQLPRPATFLAWNIVLTILCCTPFSVAGIVTAIFVSRRFNRGDYAGARQMSEITEWLVILAITFGIVSAPFSMISWLG